MDYILIKGVARKRGGKKLVNVCMVTHERSSEVSVDFDLWLGLAIACIGSGYDLLKEWFSTNYITPEEYEARAGTGSLAWIESTNTEYRTPVNNRTIQALPRFWIECMV
jgi:hypothetical protein